MVDVARARRMAVRIREIAASTLELQVKDPRLGMVTLTDARLTPDLREATLFYTVYGDGDVATSSAIALSSAVGVVRAAVGKQLGVRYTPSITFVSDAVPETAASVEALLERARQSDAELAAVREGKQPIGDADPYRKPVDRTAFQDTTFQDTTFQDTTFRDTAEDHEPDLDGSESGQPA